MHKNAIVILIFLSITLIIVYLLPGLDQHTLNYFLTRRLTRIVGMLIVAFTIALATMTFQSLTQNRILTPSMLGFDSLYIVFQTLLVFIFGSVSSVVSNIYINFFMTLLVMLIFATVLYSILLKKVNFSLLHLLLVGIVLSTFFRSISSFLQMIIDPNEFSMIQDRSFASFNNMNINLMFVAVFLIIVVLTLMSHYFKFLDIVALGKDQAINLGVSYNKLMTKALMLISFLIAVSTALIGPIMFLGLLSVNIGRQLSRSYQHKELLSLSFLIGFLLLITSQILLDYVFNLRVPISVVINFLGGLYILKLLLKESAL